MALSLSGNLIEIPFSDVLAVLNQQKATGTLTCGTGNAERSIYVNNGQIIFATSKDERDRLGEVMVAAAPGTKLNPVSTPPVLTVTSAVACCHHGFLTERTGTTSPLRRLQSCLP